MRSYAVTLGGPAEHVREFENAAEARAWAELHLATHPGHEVRWTAHNHTGERFLLAHIYNEFGTLLEVGVATVREVAA